ncbi:MAG: L,D-transpeptidase family protein [Planctomycetota bacterium]
MKSFLVLIIVLVAVAGFVFWDKLFPGDSEAEKMEAEEQPVVVKAADPAPPSPREGASSSYQELARAGRWQEAVEMIGSLNENEVDMNALATMHYCLAQEGRWPEAEDVLASIMSRETSSPISLSCVLISMKNESLTPVEKRRRLSRVAGSFPSLDAETADWLAREVKTVNAMLPVSIQGLVEMEKYKVVPNDCLWNICKDYRRKLGLNMESGLICLLNGLEKDVIYPGQTLMIPKKPVTIKIYRNNWLLTVFIGDCLLAAYRVGLGRMNKTPAGKFLIKTRLEDPDWYSDQHGRLIPFGDPDNILGTRWLGFESQEHARGFGIHGTTEPESIGKNLSSGCIRMLNEDVESLFNITARGTSVEVM